MLSVAAYSGAGCVEAALAIWDRVLTGQPRARFFHRYAWLQSYAEALERDPDNLQLFVITRGSDPVALIPMKFTVRRMFGVCVRVWGLPEHPHLPLADIVCAADVNVKLLLETLRDTIGGIAGKRCDALRFGPLLEESPISSPQPVRYCLPYRAVIKTCDEIECDGDYDCIRTRFSRNFRSNLNKARNKLNRKENVQFLTATQPAELGRAYAEFLELEASGWKGVAGAATAIRLHPEIRSFYNALMRQAAGDGSIVINCLKVDGRLVAAQFCMRDCDTLYILKLAYDENNSRIAPGNMLLEYVIQKGIEDGAWRYVNLVGSPPWFRDWSPRSTNVYDVWLCRFTPAGIWAWTTLNVKAKLAFVYRRMVVRKGKRHRHTRQVSAR